MTKEELEKKYEHDPRFRVMVHKLWCALEVDWFSKEEILEALDLAVMEKEEHDKESVAMLTRMFDNMAKRKVKPDVVIDK